MTHEQIKAEADDFANKPYYNNGKSLSVAPRLYLKKGWIAARTLSMQEREKEIADAFEAGELYGKDQQNVLQPGGQTYPDKQQYIKQITGKK